MQVIFKSAQTVGKKPYPASSKPQTLPDKMALTQPFQTLVKAGKVVVLARSEAEIKMQASKDAMAAKQAWGAKKKFLADKPARDAKIAFAKANPKKKVVGV
jgi:hypothetical protein